MERDDIRDAVIDFLFAHFPALLEDDTVPEGLTWFAHRVWQAASIDERRKRIAALREPRTFERN